MPPDTREPGYQACNIQLLPRAVTDWLAPSAKGRSPRGYPTHVWFWTCCAPCLRRFGATLKALKSPADERTLKGCATSTEVAFAVFRPPDVGGGRWPRAPRRPRTHRPRRARPEGACTAPGCGGPRGWW